MSILKYMLLTMLAVQSIAACDEEFFPYPSWSREAYLEYGILTIEE